MCFKLSRVALAAAIVFWASSALRAQDYEFLTVSGNGVSGDLAFAQFDSNCERGFIRASHHFSPGGAGPFDNLDQFVDQSRFPAVFPNITGDVEGHIVSTHYGASSLVTFNLSGYQLGPDTIFGMWNTTSDAVQPPYRVELLVNNNAVVPTFTQYGTGDNTGADGVPGRHQMVFNTITGEISAGAVINGGGTHTNALFWNKIPAGTTEIRVYGNLSPIPGNTLGDGVGYYFAEICVPEPASFAIAGMGLSCLATLTRRRRG
jgi:hypothetical protein